MRVISGCARGLKLNTPFGSNTRPTLDRVKEAVFSMLLPYLNAADILDLFAGSGALGVESLSRGAKKAVFVDNSDVAIECINSNVSAARFNDRSVFIKSDAINFLKNCTQKFDVIFLDPPYSRGMYSEVLHLIQDRQILKEDGLIVVEWDFEIGFINECRLFEVVKERKYGRIGITVLKWGLTQ